MIELLKQRNTTVGVLLALSLTGCTRFETRMQANGSFEYQDAQLISSYQTGSLTNDEARSQFDVPVLSKSQKENGLLTKDVDIRPPTQLMPVIDGVLLDLKDQQNTKIWFNTFSQQNDISAQVWQLLESYLADLNVPIITKDENSLQLQTGKFTQKTDYGNLLNGNEVAKQSSFRFTLEKLADGHSVALSVDALSYAEKNEGKPLKFKLSSKNKKNIELRFVNDLLAYAYKIKEADEAKKIDSRPLPIKLGFDDNQQMAWLIDADFSDTWKKLPALLSLLKFDIVEGDKNMGYFLLKFNPPSDDYWTENNLNKFELNSGEYFIQLGELGAGNTSILWLDQDKKPLADQTVTDIYLAITEQVRNVLLLKDKQTKAL